MQRDIGFRCNQKWTDDASDFPCILQGQLNLLALALTRLVHGPGSVQNQAWPIKLATAFKFNSGHNFIMGCKSLCALLVWRFGCSNYHVQNESALIIVCCEWLCIQIASYVNTSVFYPLLDSSASIVDSNPASLRLFSTERRSYKSTQAKVKMKDWFGGEVPVALLNSTALSPKWSWEIFKRSFSR